MRSFSKILLPVDFSERSAGAARYAQALARHFQAELILLHVLTPPQQECGDRLDRFLTPEPPPGLDFLRVTRQRFRANLSPIEYERADTEEARLHFRPGTGHRGRAGGR